MCRRSVWWVLLGACSLSPLAAEETRLQLDPAAWGSDHVGQPLPEYVTGDECLFCHRQIGKDWAENRHQQSLRHVGPEAQAVKLLAQDPQLAHLAEEVQFVLGDEQTYYLLKRAKQYGKLSVLRHGRLTTGKVAPDEIREWDQTTFADRCAGCHATAVQPESKAFSAVSLDCYVCHGDVPLEHTKNTELVLLSPKNRKPREVVSICGQCHLRGGKSRSSKLSYPNSFVAGDNLLRDFEVDLSPNAIGRMSSQEQHIFLSVRAVALFGTKQADCLACHEVHAQSTAGHRELSWGTLCKTCHTKVDGAYELRSPRLVPNPTCRVVSPSRLKDQSDGRD